MESSLPSCGHICTNLGTGSGSKGRTEEFVKAGQIIPLFNGRCRYFHISEKQEMEHFIVNGAFWCDPLIFLTH